MPFIEQILYGHDHLAEAGGRQELAHSAGMGTDASAEIHGLCEAWGQAPELGLQYPVLMSHPLQSTMPSMRGRLFAVIRASAGDKPLFHAVVLTDALYASFGRNPYAVAGVVEFREDWNGQRGMERLEIDPEDRPPLVEPEPGQEDVGLVDEAVLAFLQDGKLQLPLEQGLRDSERALALIIASLPEASRKELRFASFTTVKGNNYGIAAVETEGAAFAAWRRLMMARLDTGATPQQKEYKELIAGHLAHGDLNAVHRTSTRHNFAAPTTLRQDVALRPGPSEAPAAAKTAAVPVP
ncbi:hypothetical protein KDM41_17620, partial [bacterium]|nr:hypothetical protein [bacterium]